MVERSTGPLRRMQLSLQYVIDISNFLINGCLGLLELTGQLDQISRVISSVTQLQSHNNLILALVNELLVKRFNDSDAE